VDTGRDRVRAALTARDRGQGRLRAVTATIGAASVLAGGGITAGLASAAQAQTTASAAAHGTSSAASAKQGSSTSSAGTSGSDSASSGSSGSTPGSSGLKPAAAPSSSSGSSQVTSGGS